MKPLTLLSGLLIAFAVTDANAQIATAPTPTAASAPTLVPALVPYAGIALAADGKPIAGEASATFLLFKEERGGGPLWSESQTVAIDAAGHYDVKLGAGSPNGLPLDTFAAGDVRWLEVQIAGQPIGQRILLTSVPYALKAADSATLGGLPASAFVLASGTTGNKAVTGAGITPDASATNVTTTGGTNLYLPKFSGASTVVNSQIYDTGTSVGIGDVPNASARLDVNGPMIMRGNMTVSRTGNATASKAYPSYGFDFFSNAYNSSTKATVNPYFQLQSEPTGNDTSSPSATFNLLFSNNGSAPAETGLSINPNGILHFATGQTFPGGGGGTITGVTAGSGLTGGGTSGNVTLNVDTTAVPTLSNTNTFTGSNIFGPSIYENTDVNIDNTNSNTGYISPGLRFGSASGEGITSQRTSGGNQYGLDFFTNYIARMFISASGHVSIGELSTTPQLSVLADQGEGIEVSGTYVNSEGTDGLASYGGSTNYSSGTIAGRAALLIGGDADVSTDAGYGVLAQGGEGNDNKYTYGGAFYGGIDVTGGISTDVSRVEIDHPTDPANKYLVHASVQSSEMMNMYTGNVTTDVAGHATVALPAWFEAENADFRYQLTVIGQQAQAWVAKKVGSGEFQIATSPANVEVSWQITAIRQDAYAKANPLVVEKAKPAREIGFYKHPELYGQPRNKQTEWGRNPATMQRIEAQRAKAKKPQANAPAPTTPVSAPDLPARSQMTRSTLAAH